MSDHRAPPTDGDIDEARNYMYNITSFSHSSASTIQYDGNSVTALREDEKSTTPAKPGIQRGKLYYGWTKSRWLLLFSNIVYMTCSIVVFCCCMATYGNGFWSAPVIVAANANILGVALAYSLLSILSAGIGMAGIVKKDRRLLGWYSLLLWPCFALLCTIGYLGYKQGTWNLKSKLGMQWRYSLSNNRRIALQNTLHCCGYENPSDHATYYARCFPKSLLPGCQHKLHEFESSFLQITYIVAFTFVPVQLVIMIVSILCSNHVTLQFGRRERPHIAYLDGHSDWRSWERENKEKNESSQDCDAKGLPYEFSPIDLYSQSTLSLDNDAIQAQSKSSAVGNTLPGREATRRRSAHRQIQR